MAGPVPSHQERGEISMGAVYGPRPTQLRGIAIIGLDSWGLREQPREFRSGAARKGLLWVISGRRGQPALMSALGH